MKSKLFYEALASIAKSEEAQKAVMRRAKQIKAAAGPGYEVSGRVGRNRARASVRTDSFSARVRNSRDNTLVRLLH